MTEQQRYEQVDIPFYRDHIAPILPPEVLDFHAHVWKRRHFLNTSPATPTRGEKYMVTQADYPVEALLADARRIFPDRVYKAVCFGQPTPVADPDAGNAYVAEAAPANGLYPLMLMGRGWMDRERLEDQIRRRGFFGYKVFINWIGDDYGDVGVSDMIGPTEMAVADALGLVVLLHVPRSGRLTDPEVQREVIEYATGYPNACIVLAHCGRCYLPDQMEQAVGAIRELNNVYVDTAMVMDPTVLEIVLQQMDSRRLLFATDLPVAAMRGRRVYVMDHWVDVVTEGYPASAFRVASADIRATFMAGEIVLAIARAARRVGLSDTRLRAIFYDNAMAVLEHVMGGEQLRRVNSHGQGNGPDGC